MFATSLPWEVVVPLSENEQRLLEQMERALYAEDPKFASTMRGASRRPGALPRMLLGGVGVIGGLVVLILGVANAQVVVGVVGFALMLAGTVYFFSSRHRGGPAGVVEVDGTVRSRPAGKARARAGFMERMEQRWERRRDQR